MWASLPYDLLVDILCHLDAASAVVRCAGICKLWRRAVIANASRLQPYPDRFNPNLLLGFFHKTSLHGRHVVRLQHVPGPFKNVLASNIAADTAAPAAAARGGVNAAWYDVPLSSRDGFLLLGGGPAVGDLCLCNPLTGSCSFVPAAAFGGVSKPCRYVLIVTGGDGDSTPGDASVWIIAVKQGGARYITGGMTYRVFSTASGEWGEPVVVDDDRFQPFLCNGDKDVVVGRDSVVYWLVESIAAGGGRGNPHDGRGQVCVLAVDVRTKRSWRVQLPERFMSDLDISYYKIVLATSDDGRLSLIFQRLGHKIDVWALVGGDGRWMLRRTIDMQGFITNYYCHQFGIVRISGFCPRSGCLYGDICGDGLLIDIDRGSVRPTDRFGVSRGVTKCPYEMDWRTYISKMKYF